ncbi:hypothetical protein, partial [Streptomyces lonarensis]|uniref:hypothetical protein n=1 Tax=Streptomyces lonarensis TaxID=700599 RepID=UPI001ADD8FCA
MALSHDLCPPVRVGAACRAGPHAGSGDSSAATLARDPARPVIDPEQLLTGLNEQQRAAVTHSGAPLL